MLQSLQLRYHKLNKFRAKIEIQADKGPFLLKTVTTQDELVQALKLRYSVFHNEMTGKTKTRGLDVDSFDFNCDHLIIIDKKTSMVVGTYRLNSSLNSAHFYSAGEFNLRRVLEQKGPHLELGRACIHKDFRKGMVINLLWRGIAQYMNATDSSILFGCASILTESPRQAALLYHHFSRQGLFHPSALCPPTREYSMPGLDLWISRMDRPFTDEEQSEVEELVPPLCKSYIRAGAYLGGEPAYDSQFKCIDFLTILPRENLNKVLWRKYGVDETSSPAPLESARHPAPNQCA